MSRRYYRTDGAGRWWCTEWSPQCDFESIFDHRCQGTHGHRGDHWSYREDGTYQYSVPGGGGGWIPPGHKDWISPFDKHVEYHMEFFTEIEVLDVDLISKLELGEVDDPVDAPCTDEEIQDLRRMGRLPAERDLESNLFKLEKQMIPSDEWDKVPHWVIDMFHEDIESGCSIGFGHNDELGWYAMSCGQGPCLVWSERERK